MFSRGRPLRSDGVRLAQRVFRYVPVHLIALEGIGQLLNFFWSTMSMLCLVGLVPKPEIGACRLRISPGFNRGPRRLAQL